MKKLQDKKILLIMSRIAQLMPWGQSTGPSQDAKKEWSRKPHLPCNIYVDHISMPSSTFGCNLSAKLT